LLKTGLFLGRSKEIFCAQNLSICETVHHETHHLPDPFMAFSGKGKPEPLKHKYKGFWSRRIDAEHGLIYKVKDEFGL